MTDPDAIARRQRQAAAGFHPQEPTPLKRPVPLLTEDGDETGAGEAAFTVIKNPATDMPEGRVQVLSHHTEDLVWQEAWMRHETGIVALRDVIIVPEDLGEAEDRYARFTEVAPVRLDDGLIRYPLARGGILLATPDRAASLLPGAPVPPAPGVAGYALLTDDPAVSRGTGLRAEGHRVAGRGLPGAVRRARRLLADRGERGGPALEPVTLRHVPRALHRRVSKRRSVSSSPDAGRGSSAGCRG